MGYSETKALIGGLAHVPVLISLFWIIDSLTIKSYREKKEIEAKAKAEAAKAKVKAEEEKAKAKAKEEKAKAKPQFESESIKTKDNLEDSPARKDSLKSEVEEIKDDNP